MHKKVLILGGDGFCGWPTALHLSQHGHDVSIIDNLSRRKIDIDLGIDSLTPIASMETRLAAWQEISNKRINFAQLDIARHYEGLLRHIEKMRPDVIVHFAEQRAAPYSMRNGSCKRYTVDNNLRATHNVLCAIVESGLDIHLIHLGSMGVYGYESVNIPIPEGYLPISITAPNGECVERTIPYPPAPGSIYHMTKCQDALFFYYYNKNDNVRITDLHQGIVWGTATKETKLDERLVNRFDYDGDYGTVLNRFLVQSVLEHPLTVHGAGGQSRAFIHLQNTGECIRLGLENPPQIGVAVRIFNQGTEVHEVLSLAKLVAKHTGATIKHYRDPRQESEINTLKVHNNGLQKLGLEPILLQDELTHEIRSTVEKYKHRCNLDKIICTSLWNKDKTVDLLGKEHV